MQLVLHFKYLFYNSILYKERKDLSINDENIESISLEIINKKRKNPIVTNVYRPPNGKIKPFKNFFKNLFSRHKRSVFYFAGDFNLNLLDYETNTKVKNFFNLMFSFNLIPVINKVTRVTKTSVTNGEIYIVKKKKIKLCVHILLTSGLQFAAS